MPDPPPQTPAASPAGSVEPQASVLADLSPAALEAAVYDRLRGHRGLGPPFDPRVGPEPYRWLVDAFEQGDAGLQVRLTTVMKKFLVHLSESPDRWPLETRVALLDWIKASGRLMVEDLHRRACEAAWLDDPKLGAAAHAGLLKCLLALGWRESPAFWLDQLEKLGAEYGALVFRGLAEHSLHLAMLNLPQLTRDPEARHMIRWALPWLVNRYALSDVLQELDKVRTKLDEETYGIYRADLQAELSPAVPRTAPVAVTAADVPRAVGPARPLEDVVASARQKWVSSGDDEFVLLDARQEAGVRV